MSVDNAASFMHRTSSRLTGSTDSQFLDVGRKGGKVLCALCFVLGAATGRRQLRRINQQIQEGARDAGNGGGGSVNFDTR